MQFIDQAPAYRQKSLSLKKAVELGRARVTSDPDTPKLGYCFRPELKIATGFDRKIDTQVSFNDLPTSEKLDLLITGLLPDFFHPDMLPQTGRDSWVARFVIDGNVFRTLKMDPSGIHAVDNSDMPPAFELETDIMTLMAILRSTIADFHNNKNALLPAGDTGSLN